MKLVAWIFSLVLLAASVANSETKHAGSDLIVSKFSLTNHQGKLVTEKDYYGKYSLIFFGFTSCPKICPLGLSTMASVLKKLGIESEKMAPIFISIDPERDNSKKLEEFLANFSPLIIGLTGTKEQIDDTTKSFRAYYTKLKDSDGENYSFDHSAVIYLMDQKGMYIKHFESLQGVDKIAEEIKEIIKE